MAGRDAAESADLARSAVADGYDALVVMGGDGMVHLALQAVVGSATTLGVIATGTGNDVSRTLGIPGGKPAGGGRRRRRRGAPAASTSAASAATYFATVLAAGFDSLVNERANAMRWPKGQMRYNLATLAELRVFRPLAYTLELDGERRVVRGDAGGGGQLPVVRRWAAHVRRGQIDDGLLDVVIIKPVSKLELVKVYPRLFKGTHVTPSGLRAPPGAQRPYRRGRGGGLRRRRAARPAAGSPSRSCLPPVSVVRARDMSVLADFAALYDFPLDDFQRRACESLQRPAGVLVAAPTGIGQDAGGRVRRTPGAR